MGIVIFTSENMDINVRKGKCAISANRQGQCTLSSTFVREMGLKADDLATLSQNDENPEEWYVYLGAGFKLRPTGKTGIGLMFNCSVLANALLDSRDKDGKSGSFEIDMEPREFADIEGKLYAIL